ncbi:ligase-associated DNA damage response endonuclease PdeM [Rhodopirellula sp. MGV]|uniref:ligase-associated DNA damage response endonuclease PdeM n=1 Tax=Rhodopirellula sp. MGV TaxID=2023130 RepID=UPI001304045E|nr:ligase-associated DNA damage response endonuclease PdeM [Rhodopirellula sp. MGV]
MNGFNTSQATDASLTFVDVTLRDQRLRLLAGGGVYHRDRRSLFVADLHLGKDTTFRRHGLPVPKGSCEATLNRVAKMIDACEPAQLFFLGDMFHAKSSVSDEVDRAICAFRDRFSEIPMTLVRGNHDASFRKLPSRWAIDSCAENFIVDELRLCHHPVHCGDDKALALAGHLHPAFALGTVTERLGNLPCFWYTQGCLILPAIGEFTGTYRVRRQAADDRVWVVADETVLEIPNV